MNAALSSQRVLTPAGLRPACVVLDGEHIAAVVPPGEAPGGAIDLGELVLMPALVDTHVHVNEPGRTEWEGFASATRAAALGGVALLADMPLNSLPVTTTMAALEAKIAATRGQLWVDCALWGGVIPGNAAELGPMARAGVRGFKCFLCPSGIDEFPPAGEADLLEAMPELKAAGVPLLAHAELELPLAEAPPDADPTDYATYLHSRPKEWEDAAVALLVDLCRRTGCAVHVVHLSSSGALEHVRRAKAEGLPFTAETCPHYLCLRAEDVPRGSTAFKCAPPIREDANREALWAALADGTLDFVVTDHSPCVPGLKLPELGDFLQAWGGIASLQLGLAAVATEARARGFGLPQLQRWMSAAPSTLLGLPPHGLFGGARGDLVAWDPDAEFVVDPSALAHKHPVTPYAGRTLRGVVHHTWVRGHQVVRDGQVQGEPAGRLLLS
jgi:allantoinase